MFGTDEENMGAEMTASLGEGGRPTELARALRDASRVTTKLHSLRFVALVSAMMSCLGELTEREKSMMYRTGVVQKRQGVS